MRIIPAKRTENVRYAIRDVVVEADRLKRQGKRILHLNIGNPNIFDFFTPKHMIEAVKKAMDENKNGYAHSMGLKEAREAILKECESKGINGVDTEDILITNGVSEGAEMCLSALVNSGENFLTPSPGYPVYTAIVSKLEAVPNQYRTEESEGWEPDVEDMRKRINEKTKAIVLINPNNPTGSLYSRKTLESVIDLANEHDLVIFSDEIYDKIILDGEKHVSTASLTDEVPVITFNGLSKNYLVPGWRIGWIIFKGKEKTIREYREAVYKLARARLCSNHPLQYAIKPALEGPQDHIKEMNDKLRKRRDLTYKRLNEIKGFSCVKPKGAFYAFPKIELDVKSDFEFVMDVLHKKHILLVHGTGFGYERPDHFRIVFLPPPETLSEAYDRLEEYVKENYK
jgi:alanine-synthesizing transaminase